MSMQQHKEAANILMNSSINERNTRFREALGYIDNKYLSINEASTLTTIYFRLKDISLRYIILSKLFNDKDFNLKQFFADAYKKERYLDMKLQAVRGYANYASQEEVEKIMEHFMKILKNRPESTPYDYQEYEYLRAVCGLPYLIKRYGYSCFLNVFEQEEKQYNNMPDAFKGHYTFDENGTYIALRNSEETKKMLDDFFKSKS